MLRPVRRRVTLRADCEERRGGRGLALLVEEVSLVELRVQGVDMPGPERGDVPGDDLAMGESVM